MSKFRKWNVKNLEQSKNYKTALGTTDYDIPMFGYKSVLLIILSIVLSMFLIPAICNIIHFWIIDCRIYSFFFAVFRELQNRDNKILLVGWKYLEHFNWNYILFPCNDRSNFIIDRR